MPDITVDGIRYHVEEAGAGTPLVLLHGFTGSTYAWQHLIPDLSTNCRVIAIDLLGHGKSDAPEHSERFAFTRVIDDLAAVMRQLTLTSAVWAGYSMGGRVALALAIEHPALVDGLILESASPGLFASKERAERRYRDEELAATIERDGVPQFVANWERLPLWASQASLPVETLQRQRGVRLGNTERGLARSLRGMGTGSQPSYWERLSDMERPVLVLAGQQDAKFARIATEMQAALPNAELDIIPGAGHAIHLEQPQRYLALVTRFLEHLQNHESHELKEVVA